MKYYINPTRQTSWPFKIQSSKQQSERYMNIQNNYKQEIVIIVTDLSNLYSRKARLLDADDCGTQLFQEHIV